MNKRISQFVVAFVIFTGCSVLIGWQLDIALLKIGFPNISYGMKPNAALCFLLAGISIGLLRVEQLPRWLYQIARGCALLTSSIGLLTLIQYFFGCDFGIDEFLFEQGRPSITALYPGRMGELAAFNFFLSGIALLLLSQKNRQRVWLLQSFCCVVLVTATVILLGYLFEISIFYDFIVYTTPTEPYTAVAFIVLCLGILFTHPNHGIMRALTSSSIGGVLARRLLPWAIALPPAINWITLHAAELQPSNHSFIHGLQTAIIMTIFSMLICWNAYAIDRVETRRLKTEQRLWESERQFRRAVMDSPLPIMIHAEDGEILQINHALSDITGYQPEDIPTFDRWTELAYGQRPESVRETLERLYNLDCRMAEGEFTIYTCKGEMRIWDFYSAPLGKTSDGRRLVLSTAIDITRRKQAEEAFLEMNCILERRVKERTAKLAEMNLRLQCELRDRERVQSELRSMSDRLQYLLTGSPAVIFSCKSYGDYGATFISENVTELLGHKSEDFLENSDFWSSHVHPEDIEQISSGITQLYEKNCHSHQYRFRHANGEYRWLQAQTKLIRNEIGEPVEIVGYLVDISERKALEMEVAQQQQLLNSFISCSPVGIAIFNSQMQYTLVNDTLAEINGVSAKEHIGKYPWDVLFNLTPRPEDISQQVLSTGQPVLNVEITGETQKLPGVMRTWLVSHFPIYNQTSHPFGVGVMVAEITERRQAELALTDREAMLRAIGDNLPNGAIYQIARELDGSNRFHYISAGIENLFEVQAEDALKDSSLLYNQFLENDYQSLLQATDESMRSLSVFDIQLRIQTPSKKYKWLHFRSTPRRFEDGRVIWNGLVVDVTQMKQAEESFRWQAEKEKSLNQTVRKLYQQVYTANQKLQLLATLDDLTQIANRRRFDDYLKQEWQRLAQQQAPLSLILADVDYFKCYNDTYGHLAGDACLVKIAQAISRAVKRRPADLVARYGGEEFVIILPDTDADESVLVVQSIQKEIREQNLPHTASKVGRHITLSFGIATTFPCESRREQTIIEAADWALYQAKKERNCYHSINLDESKK